MSFTRSMSKFTWFLPRFLQLWLHIMLQSFTNNELLYIIHTEYILVPINKNYIYQTKQYKKMSISLFNYLWIKNIIFPWHPSWKYLFLPNIFMVICVCFGSHKGSLKEGKHTQGLYSALIPPWKEQIKNKTNTYYAIWN